MTGGRSKRRTTVSPADATAGSGTSGTLLSPSLPSADGLSMAAPSVALGVDLYTQARKALTERCPFDSDETAPRFGTLPSALTAFFHKKSDGRRKHRKVQEDAAGKAVGPGRPPAGFSAWEKTEEYFRPVTLDDIDLLVTRLPPDSCFYITGSENGLEEVVKDEAVPDESSPGEMDVGTSSVVVKDELESVQAEAAQTTLIDGEVACSTALSLEEPEVEDKKSLNWILGCKQRFLLTSGRSSKKRKLHGEDLGLEQLLQLPRIEADGAATPLCDFCYSEESEVKSNRLLSCDSCNVSVHQKCYGIHEVPSGGWLCSWCNHLEAVGRKTERNADDDDARINPCLLCPKAIGALKPLAGNLESREETKFVHLFCSLWIPGMYVEDVGAMEPVLNVEGLQETRRRLVCNLCKVKHGTCVRCSHGACRTALHPVCARAAKHQMEIWGKFGLDTVELRVFCSKHSHVQNIDGISSTDHHPLTASKDDMVGSLLPESIPIKRLPRIKITRRSKDNDKPVDGKPNSISDEGAKNDSNLDKENLVIKLRPGGGCAQSNEMEGFVALDNGNVLQDPSDPTTTFRKTLGNATGFVELNASMELLYEDDGEDKSGGDLKEVSDCSHLVVENSQNFEADIIELKTDKTDSLERPEYDACLADSINNQDVVGPCSRPFIHPFILKKLRELQNQWCLLHKQRIIKTSYNDKLSAADAETVEDCLSFTAYSDQSAEVKNMQTLDISPTDEIEGELLYLQNCLLDRVTSIMHSCEGLIYKITSHLPQELDALRRKRWDMVLVNQYLCEVKEAKKKGRKERRHKEAQAILAAATAAAAASRNSVLRKDAIDGISSSQQNPLKISTATRRATVYSPPVPRPKETISRSSVPKVSSDKHSGDFKLPDFAKENVLFCDVCWRTETIVNRIFVCFGCKVAVHLDCYRRLKDPTGPWRCELCEDTSLQSSPRNQQLGAGEKSSSRAQCSFCSGVTGAFRKSANGEWVHAFCAEWLLESTYKRGQQNLIGGTDAVSKEKDVNTCCICHYRLGLCLKCSYGHCQAKFHPTCARSAGLFMNIKAIGGRFQHKAYCEKHSMEQREKVDSQHGAEELKNIKQVRVDLEKVRLLCERIIRREKLKRDLVVCSHGILASRRDCVAFSAMVRSSFTPGISSESATTSIDNPSYSGAFQRRDDMAVESTSTIHGRYSCRLLMDVDGKTDDSSMSQLSNKRKIAGDRVVFSGKQLPHRPAAARASSNPADDGETRSKDRKFL